MREDGIDPNRADSPAPSSSLAPEASKSLLPALPSKPASPAHSPTENGGCAPATAGPVDGPIQSYLANPVISTTTVVTKNEDQIYKCPLCHEDLVSQNDFTSHIRAHNEVKPCNDPNDPTGQAKVYYCCLCGKMLSSFSSLDRHMLVHSGERPFSCELCGQTFTTNGNMHRHKRTHSAKELADFNEANGGLKAGGRRAGRKRKADGGGKNGKKTPAVNVAPRDPNGNVDHDVNKEREHPPSLPIPIPDLSGVMKFFSTSKPLPFLPTTPISITTATNALNLITTTASSSTNQLFPVTTSVPFTPQLFPQLAKAIQADHEVANCSGRPPLSAFTTSVVPATATAPTVAVPSLSDLPKLTIRPPQPPPPQEQPLPISALKRPPTPQALNLNLNGEAKDDSESSIPPPSAEIDDGDERDLADVQSIISVTKISGLNNNNNDDDDDGTKDVEEKSDTEEREDEEGLLPPGSRDDHDPIIKDMKLKGEFPCRLCPAVYPNLRALKGHNKEHMTKAPYECNVGKCEYSSSDKSTLARHMRTHTGEKPFECRLCNYGFTTKANCERHLKNKHGKTGRDTIRENLIVHETDEPDANALHKMHLEAHREGSGDFRCKVCKQHFETSEKVIGHAIEAHPAYQNDVDHIFEIMKRPRTGKERATSSASSSSASLDRDLGGAPSMVPRATNYPPLTLSQIRPNKSRKSVEAAAATKDGDSVMGEDDDDDDDAPLDLSSKSRSPPPPPPPQLQPPKLPLPPPLTVGPASLGLPIQQQVVPSAANIAAAALSAANLDPAIREEVYKAACAMAMQPIILPQVRPAVTPQAVAAAAAALTGGLALPFPGLIQANASVEGLEAEIKRRLQHQQHAQSQAQAAAALAAMGMLKGPLRPPLPLQQQPHPPPLLRQPPPPPPQSTALPPSADVTAFISAAQREILRKQQQGKAIAAAAAAAAAAVGGGGGGGVSALSIKPPSGISPPFPRSSVEINREDAAAEQGTLTPPLPPPPPPLKRMMMPAVVSNGIEHDDQETEMEDDESNYKMVIKNGVLMKKQKQRRYRTERPYGCDHCSARFTLRSNMERHIKQQHPEHWASKPRGGRRNNAMAAPVLAPHLRPPMAALSIDGEEEEAADSAALEDQVRKLLLRGHSEFPMIYRVRKKAARK